MVGGGPGAFIGNVHRMAAALDGTMDLVAGAFSADAARSKEQGKELGLESRAVLCVFFSNGGGGGRARRRDRFCINRHSEPHAFSP